MPDGFSGRIVDSIAGGGGLISLPAYLMAGLPPHMAVATNKLSSSCGTTVSAFRYLKNRCVSLPLVPSTILAAGMHISVPSGRVMTPVTSVVRK